MMETGKRKFFSFENFLRSTNAMGPLLTNFLIGDLIGVGFLWNTLQVIATGNVWFLPLIIYLGVQFYNDALNDISNLLEKVAKEYEVSLEAKDWAHDTMLIVCGLVGGLVTIMSGFYSETLNIILGAAFWGLLFWFIATIIILAVFDVIHEMKKDHQDKGGED